MNINRPQLTISLLISNRLDTIPRCLDSLRPIMEAIPCELILVDTSKNPAVHKLLQEYTDKVYEFEWCQDFAKARNEGLRRAKGEWFLYLDDDEWFVESDAIVSFFKSGEYKKYGYANYQVRNFLDAKYTHYSDGWVSRMVRVEKDTCFVSKIHEYFVPVNGARKDLSAMVYHSGYVYETPEKRREHFERNSSLLLDMIKEEPNNIRWRLQLAQEYSSIGEWELLEACCKECLNVMKDANSDFICNHIGTFYTGLVTGLLRQKKYEECIKVCRQALTDKRSREVLRAMMHLKLGENYLYLGQWDEAIDQVEKYLHILKFSDEDESSIIEQKSALLVGDALNDNNKKLVYCVLICSQLEKGNTESLIEHYEKLGWNQEVIYSLGDVEKYLVKAMWTLPYHRIFVRVILDAFRNKELRALFSKEILTQDISETSDFQAVLYAFAGAMRRIVEGPQIDDMIGYYDALQKYVQTTCQWYDFLEAYGVLELLGDETPCYIQAAMDISDYIELESKDTIMSLCKLKNAVEVMPDFAEGLGCFLHAYEELEKQRVEQQKNEMEELRIQVVAQIKTMLAAGQKHAAAQIVAQLKQMFPDNAEILMLEKQLQ